MITKNNEIKLCRICKREYSFYSIKELINENKSKEKKLSRLCKNCIIDELAIDKIIKKRKRYSKLNYRMSEEIFINKNG